MKQGVILLSMVLSMAIAGAQDFYTIQVRALSRETPLTMEELQAGMWQHKVDGRTKCFMGRFDTYEEAKVALVPLKGGKYSGAFVISSDKIFKTNTVNKEKKQSPSKPQATKKVDDKKIVPKPETKKAPQTKPAPAATTEISVYTVQIAAYRYPLYTKDFGLDEEVMEFYCRDNIYRYTVGKMEDEAQARKLLEKIRKSGYPDAFLTDYKKYEVYRIE